MTDKPMTTDALMVLGSVITSLTVAIVLIIITIFGFAPRAAGQPIALPKKGSCPSGYASSANYCTPMSNTKSVCVVKSGPCPSNYVQSGNYCCTR